MRELMLRLPAHDCVVATFNMRTNKLIVRLNPQGQSTIFIINSNGWAEYKVTSDDGDRWTNALVLVGKFLADNPTF